MADASHELRAPLTTIKGNLEFIMRASDLTPQARGEAVADALSEAERMERLVADLLTLARADAGQPMEAREVRLHDVIADLWREVLPRGKDVQLAIGRLDEVTVTGDADRLKQVGLALLDNALKYTPAGGRIQLSLWRHGAEAVLQVEDTGIGLDPEDLPHVFDRFYRADKARARDDGGTGLGLAIAKSIVERHHGTIEVESTPGQGSVFTVRLPSARGSKRPAPVSPSATP